MTEPFKKTRRGKRKSQKSAIPKHPHLTLKEYHKVRDFCRRHNIRWTKKRDELLMGGHRGQLDDIQYIRYANLLRRLEYEMTCRKEGRLIHIDAGGGNLTDQTY